MNDAGVVAEGGEWDDAAFAEGEAAVSRRREVLLAVLVSALLILVGVVGVYFTSLLEQRDATTQALEARISILDRANTALSTEVGDIGRERSQLLVTRETLTRERDGLISERTSLVAERAKMTEELNNIASTRDRVASERDRLNGRVSDLDRQLVDMRGKLDGSEGDLSAARLESARQSERAKAAESRSQLSSQLMALDNSMSKEAASFLTSFGQLGDAYDKNDIVGFQTAYAKCQGSAARLDSLRRQRDRLVSQLGL